MSTEENKAIMGCVLEGWNEGKEALTTVVDELCATNIVVENH